MMKSVCRWLVSELPGSLALGTTLQRGEFAQNAPDLCVAIMERVGGPTHRSFRDQEERRYQILSRGNSMSAAEDLARLVYDKMVNLRQLDLTPYIESGETAYHVMTSQGYTPAYIGKDAKSRYQFSANLTLRVKRL
jgi:hypothetical protein